LGQNKREPEAPFSTVGRQTAGQSADGVPCTFTGQAIAAVALRTHYCCPADQRLDQRVRVQLRRAWDVVRRF
jgi:hypothetical protein